MQEQETEAAEAIIMPPVYEHLCANGHKFDRYLKLAELDQPQTCECGSAAKRLISAPFVHVDFPAYQSPSSGKWITSRTERREDLKATNCVEYEPSMKQEMEKRHQAEDAALEKKIDEHVEKEIYSMDAKTRDKLVGELQGGLDVDVVRV